MKKIVVIGSSNVDTTLHVKDFPKPGETINATDVTTAGGGKGANQAIAAAKSGAETYFINRVGEDSDGGYITHQLKSYGVDTTYVQTTIGAKTGHAYITLNEAGQNDIIIDHGANYELTVEDLKAASDLINNWDCIIAQFETPIDVTTSAFKMAKKAGKVTILNPAPAIDKIPADLLKYTDIIMPNETESAKITGIPIKDNSTVVKAAQDALNGWDPTGGAIYYFNPNTATINAASDKTFTFLSFSIFLTSYYYYIYILSFQNNIVKF